MQFTPSKSSKDDNDMINNNQMNNNNSLEKNSINIEEENPFNSSPLKLYCSNISEIDQKNENGWTPLYRSIIANNINVLTDLLKFGANPNLQNNIGETPLYLCVDIDNFEALNILLQKNADCNISKKDGTSPLHLASKKKKEKFINILLDYGANPNLANKLYSQTPLHLAVKNKLGKDVLLKFKQNGADFFGAKDKYEKTPYDYVKQLNDENYLDMAKNIFEMNEENKEIIIEEVKEKEEKEKKKENKENEEIKGKQINNINCNDNISKLNSLFNDIQFNMINNINIDSENDKTDQNNNINEIEIIKNEIEISEQKINNINEEKYNKDDTNIKILDKNNDNYFLKENIDTNNIIKENKDINNEEEIKNNKIINTEENPIKEEIKININNNSPKINIINNQPQIYQPKKSIKRNLIKNKKIKPSKINKNILKKELIQNEYSPNELLTTKIKESNLGLGITLTSSDNDMFKSNTVKNMPSLMNDPKLSTLSENELLKNIILDTAKKIKNHNKNHTIDNPSSNNKSNSNSFSPIHTLQSETGKNNSKKIFNKTVNGVSYNNKNIINTDIESKQGMNTMNPLDMMTQIITINSIISNDAQEPINNKFSITNNNNNFNINNKDSDLLEYSKSNVTNATPFNNTEENNFTNNNNLINNNNINNGNGSSSKKNECYKKISYHNGKFLHKNNKGINLNNNFKEIEKEKNNSDNENENEENINDDESFENSDNNDIINNENINLTKYKNLSINNNKNIHSTYDNSKYSSVLDNSNNNNKKNISYNYNTFSNSNSQYNTKKENNDFIPSSSAFDSNSYKESISRNKPLIINYKTHTNQIIGNSISNTTYNSNTNNSSSKKYAKKLAILTELENSKNNNSNNNSNQPMKTSISNIDENESIMKLGSGNFIIPNDLSSKLHDWLISCDLLCYYNLLIKNKLYDINQYINDIKTNKKILSYKSIEDLGIKKPGHIYRFILKIKLDSNMLDPYIYNAVLDKYSRSAVNDIKISMSNSGYRVGCCCFRDNNLRLEKRSINSGFGDYTENINDIFAFLKKMDLLKLKENFIHNGFDQVEYIMIQMFSEYKFNKDILNECLHIYSDEDKIKVIGKLYNEKRNLCQEYNIKYDESEDKDIYEDYLKEYNDKNDNDGLCYIF